MIPEFRRILKEDLTAAPDWIDGMITPINLFFEQVYNAMNKKLSINDNVNGMVYSGQFSTPSTYSDGANINFNKFSFNYTGSFNPRSILIGNINLNSSYATTQIKPVFVDWTLSTTALSSTPIITINYITGLIASSSYNITLLCI